MDPDQVLCEMTDDERELLACLIAITLREPLPVGGDALMAQLVDCGLVAHEDGVLVLSPAGIERCQSLKLRRSSDLEARKVIRDRSADTR